MKLTLFCDNEIQISFKITSFNHYGEGFYCFTTKQPLSEKLVDFLINSIYSQRIDNTYTIKRNIEFKIE